MQDKFLYIAVNSIGNKPMINTLPVPPDKWLIIVNPNAGVKKGVRDWPLISGLLNQAGISHLCVLLNTATTPTTW